MMGKGTVDAIGIESGQRDEGGGGGGQSIGYEGERQIHVVRMNSHYSSPRDLLHCQLTGSPFRGDLSG